MLMKMFNVRDVILAYMLCIARCRCVTTLCNISGGPGGFSDSGAEKMSF